MVDPRLTFESLEAMVAELRHDADDHRRVTAAADGRSDLTIRLASSQDTQPLVRLAELDSAELPTVPTLVAETRGELIAALPLDGSPPFADPFRRTAEAVRLLELRAAQLSRDGRPRGRVLGRLRLRAAER